jgi:hypothetical protein
MGTFLPPRFAQIFQFHNDSTPPIPNLYSAHSLIGITAMVVYGVQVSGCLSRPAQPTGRRRAVAGRPVLVPAVAVPAARARLHPALPRGASRAAPGANRPRTLTRCCRGLQLLGVAAIALVWAAVLTGVMDRQRIEVPSLPELPRPHATPLRAQTSGKPSDYVWSPEIRWLNAIAMTVRLCAARPAQPAHARLRRPSSRASSSLPASAPVRRARARTPLPAHRFDLT